MSRWQLQDAKARFSQVVKSAVSDGPQEITVHGRPAAVVLSADEYTRLTGAKPSFIEFIRQSPMFSARLAVKRDKSRTRRVRV